MAGVGLTFTLSDISAFQARLARLTDFDLRPLLAEIGEEVTSQTKGRFRRGGGPGGESWEPSQRVRLHGGQTLVDTARLQNSIGWSADSTQVEIGTNVIYAAIHQFGGAGTRRPSLPARPFLPRSLDEVDGLDTILERFADRILNDH